MTTSARTSRSSRSATPWGSIILAISLALLALSVQWGVSLEKIGALERKVDVADGHAETIKRDVSAVRERVARIETTLGLRSQSGGGDP